MHLVAFAKDLGTMGLAIHNHSLVVDTLATTHSLVVVDTAIPLSCHLVTAEADCLVVA